MQDADVFIINTSFQLVNALEAKRKFSSPHKSLLILHINTDNMNNQVSKMLNHKDWDYIFDVMAYKKSAGERYAKALLQVKSKFSIVNLFIGHFNSFNQQIAFSYFNPSKLFLIDDGIATIIYQNLYICQDKTKYDTLFFRIKTYIKFLLRGVYCKFPRNLHKYTNLFTSYHFLKALPHQEVYYHCFENLLRLYKEPTHTNSIYIYIIGQPAGVLCKNQKDFQSLFEKIKSFYTKDNHHLVYIAHKRDSQSFLEYLSQAGWEVRQLDDIIEIHLLTLVQKPIKIVSFLSSALFNISMLLPNIPLEAIDIRPLIKKEHKESVEIIYKLLQKQGVSVITL